MLRPKWKSLSTSSLFRVCACKTRLEQVFLGQCCVWQMRWYLSATECAWHCWILEAVWWKVQLVLNTPEFDPWCLVLPTPCMFTSASNSFGTDSFWQFSPNDPLKSFESSNICWHTIRAARAIATASLSPSPSQALPSAAPKSSSNTSNISLLCLWALMSGKCAISLCLSRVLFTLTSPMTPSCSNRDEYRCTRSASLKTGAVLSSKRVSYQVLQRQFPRLFLPCICLDFPGTVVQSH